ARPAAGAAGRCALGARRLRGGAGGGAAGRSRGATAARTAAVRPQARGLAPAAGGAAESAVRIALLTEIPAPYRLPLFSALAAEVDLRVLFLARTDPRRGYEFPADPGFPSQVLPGRGLERGGRWVVVNRGVVRA